MYLQSFAGNSGISHNITTNDRVDITKAECVRAITSIKNGKTLGPNKIHIELFSNIGPEEDRRKLKEDRRRRYKKISEYTRRSKKIQGDQRS